MLFTELAGITKTPEDDWFDPILHADTRLFIDPFMVYLKPNPKFDGAREEIIEFFDHAFRLIAAASGPGDPRWLKAERMLLFPEPREFRIGYSRGTTKGRGSGTRLRASMVELIAESVARGVQKLERFEELPLFNEGIGPDLVSDICANVWKHRFVKYTTAVVARHQVPSAVVPLRNALFDFESDRWQTDERSLPVSADGHPILLIPHAFVKPLPTISWEDFRDYVWDSYADTVARDFGYDVKSQLDKAAIVRIARLRRDLVDEFTKRAEESSQPYDIARDPRGVYQPYVQARTWALSHAAVTLPSVTRRLDLARFVTAIVEDYRHYVEDQRGSRLLWNDDGTPRDEIAARLAFAARAEVHCAYNDVSIVWEADQGKGPVDFEFATGYRDKAALEIKLMSNSRYWHGLETQLPSYITASGAALGRFVGIALTEKHLRGAQWRDLGPRTDAIRRSTGFDIRSSPINGIPGPAASRA